MTEMKIIEDEIVAIDEKAESIIFKNNGVFKYNEIVEPHLNKLHAGDKVKVRIYGDPEQIMWIGKAGTFTAPKKPEPQAVKPKDDKEKKEAGWYFKNGKYHPNLSALLDLAKKMYPGRLRIVTNPVQVSLEKKFAIFSAIVSNIDEEGKEIEIYYGHGDASPDSLDKHMEPHFIRMAETRSIVRALRWMTNIGEASVEELIEEKEEDKYVGRTKLN